jgi:hypothetical protein
MKRLLQSSLVLAVLFWSAFDSWSYQVTQVKNGGRMTGTVTLRGDVPPPRAFPMVLYPHGEFCKKLSDGNGHVLLKEFNVDAAGALQDAVVAVQNVSQGKAFRYRDTELETVNCMFHPADVPESEQFGHREGHLVHIHPLVTVMRDPSLLTVANRDPIVHAAQVYQAEKGNRVLSFPIPVSYKPNSGYVDLEKGKRIVQIICGMHEYMQSWAWVVDNPYFAKTHAGGAFAIDNLPPGTYRVLAWHPHMQPIVKEIVIPADGAVTLDFEFDASQVVRPIYETQEQFRIPPTRDPTVDLTGCEGPYCVKREHEHH